MARLDKTTAIDGGTGKDSPEDLGLAGRHTAAFRGALRREKLATLAGIGSAFYLRLEQGRGTDPSVQGVDALETAGA